MAESKAATARLLGATEHQMRSLTLCPHGKDVATYGPCGFCEEGIP